MSVQVADRTLPDDELELMVEVARPGWRLQDATLMVNGQGSIYHLVVDTDGGHRTCVLKTAPADPERFDIATEARIQATVAQHTGVPAPDVLAVVDTHDDLRTPYYLMEAMPGDHLPEAIDTRLPAEARRRFAREMGRALGQLHDLPVDLEEYGWGVGYEPAGTLHGERPSGDPGRVVVEEGHQQWLRALREDCESVLEQLADTRFADLVPRVRAELARQFTTLPKTVSPVLGLPDLHRENLLVDRSNGRLTGVLDWEGAMAAPRGYDIAFQEWYFVGIWGLDLPEPHCDPLFKWVLDREEILAGYREATTGPPALSAQRSCYQLVFLLKDMVFIDGWVDDAWDVEPTVPLSDGRGEELAAAYRAAANAQLDQDAP